MFRRLGRFDGLMFEGGLMLVVYLFKHFSIISNKDAKVTKTKNGRLQTRCLCSICGNKKSRFVKEQEAKVILSSLGIRTPLSKIPCLNIWF